MRYILTVLLILFVDTHDIGCVCWSVMVVRLFLDIDNLLPPHFLANLGGGSIFVDSMSILDMFFF